MFLNAFNTNDIPVIPTIGNWDVFPVSSLAAAPNDPQLVSLWSVWEPLFIGGMDIIEFEEAKSTFLHGGYFSRTVLDGLISVISINTLLFFNENPLASACAAFNLLPHSERPFDPANPPDAHLIWLENQLLLARQADRRVILQGHVSPQGSDGVPVYTDSCYQWVIYFLGEYSDVIISSYFGHINKDLIQLVWQPYPLSADKEKNPAENPANPYRLTTVLPNHGGITQDRHVLSSLFTGASVIPTSSPAFRIGTLSITRADGGDSAVVRLARHQTNAADLNAANGRGGGLMYRPCGCDTRTDFGLRLLGPSDLQEWSARVESGKGGAAAKAAKKYARCIAATALTSGDAASELRSGGGGKGWGAWMLAEVGVGRANFCLETNSMSDDDLIARALAAFDAVHARDPKNEARRYHQLVSDYVRLLAPSPTPSTAIVLAAASQHLNRYSFPRSDYAPGLLGYKLWRKNALRQSAALAVSILSSPDVQVTDTALLDNVRRLIAKDASQSDPEAQLLEDAVCLAFVHSGLDEFIASINDVDKVVSILIKTMGKMSETAQKKVAEVLDKSSVSESDKAVIAAKLLERGISLAA
ncbi:Endopolyphosphatase [Entophlyctis sp. JEL0112]|nr:Endopolyphosphatase [Entophlyctis sp. JEL0112]